MIFTIGAVGFNCEQWRGDFYPEDLPLDWCAEYYANEIHAVLLESPENLAELRESLSANFCLLVSGEPDVSLQLADNNAELGYCNFEHDPAETVGEFVVQKAVVKWSNENAISAIAYKVAADNDADARALRELLEVLAQSKDGIQSAFVFFQGAICTVQMIKTAQTIGDLVSN
ncbi:MAG: hypothetical protein R3240_00485 [Gammaproteobacteria bacterium]|nr:hypothetical protein [Gammaproteobacteria bacterium]